MLRKSKNFFVTAKQIRIETYEKIKRVQNFVKKKKPQTKDRLMLAQNKADISLIVEKKPYSNPRYALQIFWSLPAAIN